MTTNPCQGCGTDVGVDNPPAPSSPARCDCGHGWERHYYSMRRHGCDGIDGERCPCAIPSPALAGTQTDDGAVGGECASCGEGDPKNECPKSRRPCGHHCNHIWTHDSCDWCGFTHEGDA